MSIAAEEYLKAKKLGNKEYQKAISDGHYPFLPALDYMLGSRTTMKEVKVGLIEIPIDFIVGTVTTGRQDAFARNFMPILPSDTEFAAKWMSLYDYQTDHGISDAITVIEFMGKFYVLEGNKRVSVLKFLEQPMILADVTRIMPAESEDSEDPEVRLYYEFLKFFKCTSMYSISFSTPGSFYKLASYLDVDLETPWPEELLLDLKSAFSAFTKVYNSAGGKSFNITPGDAFLVYLDMYKFDSLKIPVADEIKKNLSLIWKEIRIRAYGNQVAFSEEPKLEKKTVIPLFDTIMKKTYSAARPLKVLFLYDGDPATSRWINGHEKGRLEIGDIFGDVVQTSTAINIVSDEDFDRTCEEASKNGIDMIFTTSPIQIDNALKAAVQYPDIKFLNCSIYLTHSAIRTYYGRMYEAKFLLGAMAASLSDDHRICYVNNYPICGSIASINAFAIGAQMVDPKAEIYLTWSSLKHSSWRDYVAEHGLKLISGPDLVRPRKADNAYGLFKLDDNGDIVNLAYPEWKWGKYYELIIQTVLNDAYDAEDQDAKDSAVNYWWGMSSGVIDVFVGDLVPYGTKKLVSLLRKGITADTFNPFEGDLVSQDGPIKRPFTPKLSNEEIVNMSWLNSNVIGSIPEFGELTDLAQATVKANGMPIITKSTVPDVIEDMADPTEEGDSGSK
ncbi:Basic membrane lipoprotein Med, substrate-binding protein (PBP1-ABC) superfamily [Ruminococcaceae bacterium YRB3002]|nr:Basic membrane lipoprotein Med, substrate-binding protein (PBP1-ABC) superfamily [Ruminococcaceae bacterium YRB3002]